MDLYPLSDAQSASTQTKPDSRVRCSSPYSVSDSDSQYSFDSASSQESAASTATTLSTLWQQPLDADGSTQNANARVEEWSKNATSYPKAWLVPGSAPTASGTSQTFGYEVASLALRSVDRTNASAHTGVDRPCHIRSTHRQCLKAVSEYRPECRPSPSTIEKCSSALSHERAALARSTTLKLNQSSTVQKLAVASNAVLACPNAARNTSFDHYVSNVCSKLRETQQQVDSAPRTEHRQGTVITDSIVPPHPRRCSASSTRSKPSLVRQDDRRQLLVEHLVDSASQLVSVIWPTAIQSSQQRQETRESSVISLHDFVRETLKRSRTSYSTLQVTLYYLCFIKSQGKMPKCDFTGEQVHDTTHFRSLQCGRRMFLAALILASKYLQDQNYSAKAWSKITGLKVQEITFNEISFLGAVDYRLHIKDDVYHDWVAVVTRCTEAPSFGTPQRHAWTRVLDMMTEKVSIRRISTLLQPSTWTENRETDPASDEAIRSFHANAFPRHSEALPTIKFDARESLHTDTPSDNSFSATSPMKEDVVPPATVVPPTPNLGATLQTPVVTPWPASHGACTPAVGSTPSLDSSRSSSRIYCSRTIHQDASQVRVMSHCLDDAFRRQLCGIQMNSRVANSTTIHPRLVESPISVSSADYSDDRLAVCGRNPETQLMVSGVLTPPQSETSDSSEEESAEISQHSDETPKAAWCADSENAAKHFVQRSTSRPTTATRVPVVSNHELTTRAMGPSDRLGQQVGARPLRPAYQRSLTSPGSIQNVRGILRRECSDLPGRCHDSRHQLPETELQQNVSRLLCNRSRSAQSSPLSQSSAGVKKRAFSECEQSDWTATRENKLRRLVEKASHAHWLPCEN